MKPKNDKGKQIRLTLEDALKYQDKLKTLIKQLVNENRALEVKEKKEYFETITKGLLSQGTIDPVYFVQQDGWFIFGSVQSLAHRLADLSTSKVKLKTTRPNETEIIVDISELWRFLYDKFLFLFPLASAEALHISAESLERTAQGSYGFSSKDNLIER